MPLSERLPRAAWSVLLEVALDSLRQGGVPPWPSRRWPKLKRRLEQRWFGPIWGAWGDLVPDEERWPAAVQLLLHWACGAVRPDHQAALGLKQIPHTAWVEQTAWRPLLATTATSGLLPVPDLPRLYRKSHNENSVDNLCGLWAVGTSTTYRYVEKGKRQLVDAICAAQDDAQQRWTLRGVALVSRCASASSEWHLTQARSLALHEHSMDATWHLWWSKEWTHLAELLRRRALELASHPEQLPLCQALRRASMDARSKVAVAIAESFLWRCSGDAANELNCLQIALRTAELVDGASRYQYVGQALYSLGFFYNARDPDQAIGHLEAATQQLLAASQGESCGVGLETIQSAYVNSLALMAFIQLRRNNPTAKTLLQSAKSAALECSNLDVDAAGMLLKAQAEEARCLDRLDDALGYRQRALVLFERAADLREVVESQVNLGQLLAHSGRANEASVFCGRVLRMAETLTIRPEALLSAHGGMALAAMTLDNPDSAITHLHHVLRISQDVGLPRHNLGGLLNLAEAHYQRFKKLNIAEDEHLGDTFAEQARQLAEKLGLGQLETKAQSLKQTTLNPQTAVHHLLPVETSAHPGEFAKIEALRAELALPRPPAQRARTHIALSQLYLRIAAKERDAARGLMQTHGLSDLESELEALQQTWAHDGNLASQLNQRWREQVGDWLTDAQRKAVLARLLEEGSLSKSSYGEAAEVSPATASKHLGLLADKGLLEQQGRGPATRYVLPSAASSGGAPAAPPVH